jgi:hypothetical protein
MSEDKAANESVDETDNQSRVLLKGTLIEFTIEGVISMDDALALHEAGIKLLDSGMGRDVIIDLTRSKGFSAQARKKWVSFLRHPSIHRTAIVGGSIFIRTVASFVIAAAGVTNIRFFENAKEAVAWCTSDSATEPVEPIHTSGV